MTDHDPITLETEAVNASGHRPGSLRGESWITIQTFQAQRLVTGRKASDGKHAIIGLTRFGALASIPYVCSRLDDPYADWWLVKIEEALEHSLEEVNTLCQKVQCLLTAHPGMHIGIAESLEPIRVPLMFGNPYAYMGARLLVQFDTFVRMVLTARHHGLLDQDDYDKLLNLGGRAVRRALHSVLGYKNQSTNRSDIEANNARAQKARALMGDIPEAIINRTQRAKHAPGILSVTANGPRNTNPLFGSRGLTLQRPASSNTARKNKTSEPLAEE